MMSKKVHVFASPSSSASSTHPVEPTQWDKCAICQETKVEKLVDPLNATKAYTNQGYNVLAQNLLEFDKLGALDFDISRLDEGLGVEQTFISNKAKWHRSCRLKYDKIKLDRAKKRKAKENAQYAADSPVKTRKSVGGVKNIAGKLCFFCDAGEYENPQREPFREAQTHDVDQKVRECATTLRDRKILAKLADRDMTAQDAVYHLSCLSGYYYKAEQSVNKQHSSYQCNYEGMVLAELVSHIEDARYDDHITIFKLSDLTKLYVFRLEQLLPNTKHSVNSTRLKERILKLVPDLRAESHGRNVLLMFKDDIGDAVHSACVSEDDDSSIHLMHTAQRIRQEIFNTNFSFTGSFEQDCESDVVPPSLLTLISMIIDGPNIKDRVETNKSRLKIALSLSELIMFNTVKRVKSDSPEAASRHNQDRETPLPIYLSLLIHAQTRKRELIDELHSRGIVVSYDRMMGISTGMGNSVCVRFEDDKVVCPPKAKSNIFTVGCMDNIDHNPSSRTAQNSFHGTAISVMQFPTDDFPGTERAKVIIDSTPAPTKGIIPLPQAYSTVPAIAFKINDITVPSTQEPVMTDCYTIDQAATKERDWLNQVHELLEKTPLASTDFISWAAYHASQLPPITKHLSGISLLPLFNENAHSPSMVLHAMNVVQRCVHHLNPGQIPIICMDQPLYALAKQIQWRFPDVSEEKFIVMMGGLHIEMIVFRMLGEWLAHSGWIAALIKADVTSTGRAEDLERGGNVTRARLAHQVTAASIYILQKQAYNVYEESFIPEHCPLTFDKWVIQQAASHPQFQYWAMTLNFEVTALMFVRSIREGDFELYKQTLRQIIPWCFALDHINYARWLPVHIRDMFMLDKQHPEIYQQFMQGNFVVKKTPHRFSSIALDHAHEQENAKIKADGGAIGLTEDASALHRWMVAGPEIARVVEEFQGSSMKDIDTRHRDQVPSIQKDFQQSVSRLCSTINELGNPFLEDTAELFVLDTKDVMSPSVVDTIRSIEKLGEDQYSQFIEDRLSPDSDKCLSNTITKNKLPLFSSSSTKQRSKIKQQISDLKADTHLFSRMYISCQVREGNMGDFFKHENHAYPPSLSQAGELRHGCKSDLLECLLRYCSTSDVSPQVSVKVFDGPALVHMLPPKGCKTFAQYAEDIFMPYILDQLTTVSRIDLVWDVYLTDSLKNMTRDNRGSGVRRKVLASSPVPKNWQGFLRDADNKSELFSFLASRIAEESVPNKEIYTTQEGRVISSHQQEPDPFFSPCSQEEADTRIILHLEHCRRDNHTSATIRTVDTDVVILALAFFYVLGFDELYVAFGVGKSFCYIPCHKIAESLGLQKCKALPVFHALTGCDTTSSFAGRGKKSAWEAWDSCPSVTDTMVELSQRPASITCTQMEEIERFIIVLYSQTCPLSKCDEARRELFTSGQRTLEHIPPTSAALFEHTKRAIYQAGHCWSQCLVANPLLPSPSAWGWKREGDIWRPLWTQLAEAAKGCHELVHCKCKKKCQPPCKCSVASLKCTELCLCKGGCYQI